MQWRELENIVDKMQRNFHCFWQKGYVCRSQQQEWISFKPIKFLIIKNKRPSTPSHLQCNIWGSLHFPNRFWCILKINEYSNSCSMETRIAILQCHLCKKFHKHCHYYSESKNSLLLNGAPNLWQICWKWEISLHNFQCWQLGEETWTRWKNTFSANFFPESHVLL